MHQALDDQEEDSPEYLSNDLIHLILSFVVDDMSYLRNINRDEDLKWVNKSLSMYSHLSKPWKQFVYNEYGMLSALWLVFIQTHSGKYTMCLIC